MMSEQLRKVNREKGEEYRLYSRARNTKCLLTLDGVMAFHGSMRKKAEIRSGDYFFGVVTCVEVRRRRL